MRICDLRPCDILVYDPKPNASWLSKAISIFQWISGNGYGASSHVSEVASDCKSEYESTFPKSRLKSIYLKDLKHYHVRVFRYQKTLTLKQVMDGHDFYKRHLNSFYDVICILSFTLISIPWLFVCSKFIWMGWLQRGINIGPGGGKVISPNEIVNSGVLEEIGELEPEEE